MKKWKKLAKIMTIGVLAVGIQVSVAAPVTNSDAPGNNNEATNQQAQKTDTNNMPNSAGRAKHSSREKSANRRSKAIKKHAANN